MASWLECNPFIFVQCLTSIKAVEVALLGNGDGGNVGPSLIVFTSNYWVVDYLKISWCQAIEWQFSVVGNKKVSPLRQIKLVLLGFLFVWHNQFHSIPTCLWLKYVCVIWFVFLILKLLHIRFTQQNLSDFNKSMIKYMQNPIWKQNLPLVGYAYWKRMFVNFVTGYIGPSNCAQYWMWNRYLYLKT